VDRRAAMTPVASMHSDLGMVGELRHGLSPLVSLRVRSLTYLPRMAADIDL
jgi:hypothetical protein